MAYITMCTKYWTSTGCRLNCGNKLHLCRYFIQDNCRNTQCKFSHSLREEGNWEKLKELQLEGMEINDLKQALRKRNSTVLQLCKFYNGMNDGCKHGDGEDSECEHLHICRYFINNDCKYGADCKKSHILDKGQPRKCLQNHGINIDHLNETKLNSIKTDLLISEHDISNYSNIKIEIKQRPRDKSSYDSATLYERCQQPNVSDHELFDGACLREYLPEPNTNRYTFYKYVDRDRPRDEQTTNGYPNNCYSQAGKSIPPYKENDIERPQFKEKNSCETYKPLFKLIKEIKQEVRIVAETIDNENKINGKRSDQITVKSVSPKRIYRTGDYQNKVFRKNSSLRRNLDCRNEGKMNPKNEGWSKRIRKDCSIKPEMKRKSEDSSYYRNGPIIRERDYHYSNRRNYREGKRYRDHGRYAPY